MSRFLKKGSIENSLGMGSRFRSSFSNRDLLGRFEGILRMKTKGLAAMKKRAVIDALSQHNGNRTHSAKALGISIRGLRNLILQFGLNPDDSEIEKLRNRSLITSRRMGINQDSEDIAQEVAIRFIQNGKGQTVQQATIDVIRSVYGSTRGSRMSGVTGVRRAERFATSLQESRESNLASINPIEGARFIDAFLSTSRILLSGSKRAIIILVYQWGFSLEEVADLLGVTESRISQVRSELEERVYKVMAREESDASKEVCAGVQAEAPQESAGSREGPEAVARVLFIEDQIRSKLELGQDFQVEEIEPFQVESFDEASFPEWFA
jgi:predicted transcriptional regulator